MTFQCRTPSRDNYELIKHSLSTNNMNNLRNLSLMYLHHTKMYYQNCTPLPSPILILKTIKLEKESLTHPLYSSTNSQTGSSHLFWYPCTQSLTIFNSNKPHPKMSYPNPKIHNIYPINVWLTKWYLNLFPSPTHWKSLCGFPTSLPPR